ncbi:MAG: uncharacterized protein A8A55_1825 [Amphiamblys sp. WSBS2006]|nr:MAG: uncharacterized protein A8A55_1825 [Amphiamblys sp. WSBS2006]
MEQNLVAKHGKTVFLEAEAHREVFTPRRYSWTEAEEISIGYIVEHAVDSLAAVRYTGKCVIFPRFFGSAKETAEALCDAIEREVLGTHRKDSDGILVGFDRGTLRTGKTGEMQDESAAVLAEMECVFLLLTVRPDDLLPGKVILQRRECITLLVFGRLRALVREDEMGGRWVDGCWVVHDTRLEQGMSVFFRVVSVCGFEIEGTFQE